MAWITPVTTWVAGNGIGYTDLNRIEGDLKYLREETATFNGAKTFTNNITQSGGVTSLKATTITEVFGSQFKIIRSTATDQWLTINAGGNLVNHIAGNESALNTLQKHRFYTYGSDGQSGILAEISGTAVILNKPVTITGALTVDPTLGITATTTIELKKPTAITGVLTVDPTLGITATTTIELKKPTVVTGLLTAGGGVKTDNGDDSIFDISTIASGNSYNTAYDKLVADIGVTVTADFGVFGYYGILDVSLARYTSLSETIELFSSSGASVVILTNGSATLLTGKLSLGFIKQ